MQDADDIPGLIGDLLRLGTIASVDLAAATATVNSGDVVTPALPWTEMAGAFRSWSPPSVGEQVLLLCPEGDVAGALILRGLYSTAFPAPGTDANPQIHGPDGLVITFTPNGLTIVAPGGVAITGDVTVTGTLTASTDVIGGGKSLKSHKHSGVQAGGAQTGAPV
jgi:phage baseplate assembly protein gpV